MELLERYLQAVGEHLPAKGRQDTLAELRANLLAEMDEREEMAGRPLTEQEVAAVLEAHGMPVIVAARFRPQHALIGPSMFPIYWYTLKKSFPLVVLAYTAVQVVRFVIAGEPTSKVPDAIWSFWGVALTFWAIMTLGFALFDYLQQNYGTKVQPPKWSVRDLPPLDKSQKRPKLGHGVADLIVSVLVVVWLLAVPSHPYLLFGPGAKFIHQSPFALTPEWHVVYWQIIALLIAIWPLKVMMMLPSMARWRRALDIGIHVLGICVLLVLVQVRTYLVPSTSATLENLKGLAGINVGINLGFKVVLAISVIKLVWDLWRIASGAPQRQAGCATVL
jgi:hypothetical protein